MELHPGLSRADNSAEFLTWRENTIKTKGFLTSIYLEWAETILAHCVPGGDTIEVGATNGVTRSVLCRNNTFGLDITFHASLSLQADASRLPFSTQSVTNLVATDTFHHLEDAEPFLVEANRVLINGGRMILIEPWNNRWSRFIYQRFHSEPFITSGDWTTSGDGPMTRANIALPWIVFRRDRQRFITQFPELHVVKIQPMMPIAFVLSGGARTSLGIPRYCYRPVRLLERVLESLGWGLSALIIVEKSISSTIGKPAI